MNIGRRIVIFDGNLKKNNLTASQEIGKKRLRRRVKRNEIVLATTDKSGKFVHPNYT